MTNCLRFSSALTETLADLLQARQHDVDGKGIDGDEGCHQRNEFKAPKAADDVI